MQSTAKVATTVHSAAGQALMPSAEYIHDCTVATYLGTYCTSTVMYDIRLPVYGTNTRISQDSFIHTGRKRS